MDITVQELYIPSCKELNLEKQRAELDGYSRIFRPLVELKNQPVDVNGIPANGSHPPGGRRWTILYLHGGYYMFGSIKSHRNLAGNIAAAARARLLIIDYCLARSIPSRRAGGCPDRIQWLLAQDIQPNQVTLAGDSAGEGWFYPSYWPCANGVWRYRLQAFACRLLPI